MTNISHKMHSVNKFAGSIEIIISLFWIYTIAETLYNYHQTGVLNFIMIPDWLLILQMFMGCVGVWSGFQVYRTFWSIRKGYSFFLVPWVVIQILEFIWVSL